VRLIIHQALKDVRLLRWLLAAWVLLLIAYHAVVLIAGLGYAYPDRGLSAADTAFLAMGLAAFVVVAALLVQTDSPIRSTAFWVTRPISGRAMLASKLLLALFLLVILPFAFDALDLMIAGIGPSEWNPWSRSDLLDAAVAIVMQLAWILPFLAIASMTESLSQFVVVVIAEMLVFMVLGAGIEAFAPRPSRRFHPWGMLVLLPALVVVGGAVLTHAYVSRRRTRSFVLLALAPVVLVVAFYCSFPWSVERTALAVSPRTEKGLEANDVSVAVDRRAARTLSVSKYDAVLAVPLRITGLPRGLDLDIVGQGWWSPDSKPISVTAVGTAFLPARAEDVPRGGDANAYYVRDFRMTVRAGQFEQLKKQNASLRMELMIHLYRVEALAAVSLRLGATYRTGALHGKVIELDPWLDRAVVTVRETAPKNQAVFIVEPLVRARLRDPAGQDTAPVSGDVSPPFGAPADWLPLPRHLAVRGRVFEFSRPSDAVGWADWPRGWQLIVTGRRRTAEMMRKIVDFGDLNFGDGPGSPQAN
jgi:hypothetical protein